MGKDEEVIFIAKARKRARKKAAKKPVEKIATAKPVVVKSRQDMLWKFIAWAIVILVLVWIAIKFFT